jgi:hypothetical protein
MNVSLQNILGVIYTVAKSMINMIASSFSPQAAEGIIALTAIGFIVRLFDSPRPQKVSPEPVSKPETVYRLVRVVKE